MSKTAEFYRTPSQDEVEHEERLEYLEWYERKKKQEKTKTKAKEDGEKKCFK